MPYAWKITFNGEDISAKVGRFSIIASLESYCREMTLDIVDKEFYAGLDFTILPETPQVEIFTKVADTYVSQGTFYLERPALSVMVRSETLNGVWGRSRTAALGEPFAPRVSKMWTEKTTFFDICQEMCDLAGLPWDGAYSDIDDFVIHPYTFQADNVYPIEVFTGLARLAGALVTTDREDHVRVKRIDYAPSAADLTITDAEIQEITESPEWPTFGNRVRITPSGSLAGYSLSVSIPSPCLTADGTSRTKLFAQVRDADGEPVNDLAVAWSVDSDNVTLASAVTNTQEILIEREERRAKNFHQVDCEFPPGSVDGVYAYSDRARTNNLAAAGYTVSGHTITLAEPLKYCDQLLIIAYRSSGVAINYLTAGLTQEDVTVTADVEGQSDSGAVYIDNPCQCPPAIKLGASPAAIHPGEVASLLVYVEEKGAAAGGRTVFMSENTAIKKGALEWSVARLGTVSVASEQAAARNEIAGTTQCEISMFPASVASAHLADENGNPTGENLYASHSGKVVDLTVELPTGTKLLVSYTARGAALNRFIAASVGQAQIVAYIHTSREEPAEASATISVLDVNEPIADAPEEWEGDEEYGGVGGLDLEFEERGPALCRQSDGTTVKCPEGQKCCWKGSVFGCFPEGECTRAAIDPCVAENVSSDPSKERLSARFAGALDARCGCGEICENEFSVFGTTPDYDNASYRTIAEIVLEDYGLEEGSAEYWEKYELLKQEALANCITVCEERGLAWDEAANPETIAGGGSIQLFLLYGCPPFNWEVSGEGYGLEAAETTERSNKLSCVSGTCGIDYDPVAMVTVRDACGGEITARIRNTSGQWISVCSPTWNSCGGTCYCLDQDYYPGEYYYPYADYRITHIHLIDVECPTGNPTMPYTFTCDGLPMTISQDMCVPNCAGYPYVRLILVEKWSC